MEGFLKVMDKIRKKVEHREELMHGLAEDMYYGVENNFKKEGQPTKWANLRPRTQKGRAKQGHWPGKILQVKGLLFKSIVTKSNNNEATVGTNRSYARVQHFGGTTQHAARERVIHFSQVNRGKMTHGKPGTGDRFAKPGKAKYGMKVQGKAYSSTIPARPYMMLQPSDIEKMKRRALEYLKNV